MHPPSDPARLVHAALTFTCHPLLWELHCLGILGRGSPVFGLAAVKTFFVGTAGGWMAGYARDTACLGITWTPHHNSSPSKFHTSRGEHLYRFAVKCLYIYIFFFSFSAWPTCAY